MPRLSLIVAVLASALSLPSVAKASPEPILAGPWSLDQEGYGHIRPSNIFNGGDPLGRVKDIEWLTWGGSKAVGVGSGFYVAQKQSTSEGHPAAAVVVLFRLGTCRRRRAYNAIQWYFPEYGEHFNAHEPGYKLCTAAEGR